MSWGIAETASEIEKIKSESADYLNGLNSCGVIDWNTYNYAFDFYTDLLMKAYKQGEKDAQPEPCEDAVSRQAVIDAARKVHDIFEGEYDTRTPYGVVFDVQDAVSKLPSVQPKIVRCGQCKYAEVADGQDNQDGYTCQFHRGSIWFSGSYCSWAERRTND